jgi:hypothetical protein
MENNQPRIDANGREANAGFTRSREGAKGSTQGGHAETAALESYATNL